jgi:hypothetical protein
MGDMHIADYTLTIKNGVHTQEPQSYKLPKLGDGRIAVRVNLELVQATPGSFTIAYNKASDLYKKGLLIYLTSETLPVVNSNNRSYTRYVYLVSGEEKICYFLEEGSSEWLPTDTAPPLVRFQRNQPEPYLVWESGWKESVWEVKSVNNLPA